VTIRYGLKAKKGDNAVTDQQLTNADVDYIDQWCDDELDYLSVESAVPLESTVEGARLKAMIPQPVVVPLRTVTA